MSPKTPKDVFSMLLSNVRSNTERATLIYEEVGKVAEETEVKEALGARAFTSKQILAKIDECFRLIGEKPVNKPTHLHDMFVEDFRKELGEIQSPVARRLYVLAKLRHLAHLRTGEYVLADKLAFVERTRRLIRKAVEANLVEKVAVATR